MADKDRLKKYIDITKKLKKYNELYFIKSKPSITDKEYDELKEGYRPRKKYTYLKHGTLLQNCWF